jgi:hypothetical protein
MKKEVVELTENTFELGEGNTVDVWLMYGLVSRIRKHDFDFQLRRRMQCPGRRHEHPGAIRLSINPQISIQLEADTS